VHACLEAGDAPLAAEWFKRLHAAGQKLGSGLVFGVLTALAEKELMHEAKEFFHETLAKGAPADTACYHVVFDRCMPLGDAGAVEALLQRLMGRRPGEQVSAFVALLRSRAQTQDGRQAEGWMSRALELGLPMEKLFGTMVTTCARLGNTDRAEHWLERMEEAARSEEREHGKSSKVHMVPGAAVYNAVMQSYVQHGLTQRAEACFEKMLAAGVKPDAVCFWTILKAYMRGGSLAGAERWLHMARKQRVRLQAFAYGVVIDCAARAPDPERAEWWLRETIRDGLEPLVISYNVVIRAWAKRGDASRAQQLLALMCEKGTVPDVVTLATAIDSCAKAGDLARAEAIFQQVVSRGQTQPDAIVYNALINTAVQADDVARAEDWFAAMLQGGVAPDVVTYTTLILSHARAGNVEEAERALKRMLAEGIEANAQTYGALIQAFSKAGDVDGAEKWFNHMHKTTSSQASVVTFGALLNVCAKARDYQRAEMWLERMPDHGVSPNLICYTTVIDACAKAGLAERAEMWLRCLTGKPDLTPTSHSYTSAAQAYATQGKYGEVERLFAEMEKRGISMNQCSLTVLLLAYIRAKPRQPERAEAAFRKHAALGLPVTEAPLGVLRNIVGGRRFRELLAESPPCLVHTGKRTGQSRSVKAKAIQQEEGVGRHSARPYTPSSQPP